jgi:ubiquinone/menaquinone biosynthesis C-methylase UbiE
MFTESAELYDLIYSSIRDYGAEAQQITGLLRAANPRCHTVLDVACGTGEHARLLAANFGFDVDGSDLNPDFVRIAQSKHPAGRFIVADMAALRLERQYDAVLCLGSSIGYLRDLAAVKQAFECFRAHLSSDGVVIVEPWFTPELLESGYRSTRTAETPIVRVVREQTTEIIDRVSRLRFEYTIETQGQTRYVSETHELGLFTIAELLAAFTAAGLDARYDGQGLNGRGLYIAKIAA